MKSSLRPHLIVRKIACINLLPFLIILASAQLSGAELNSQAQTASVVRGRVVYADNSQPLKATRVEVFTSNPQSGHRLTTVTNERGEFQIERLPAGKYYVTVSGTGVASPSGIGMRIPLPIAAIPRVEDYPEIVPRHDAVFTVDGSNAVEIEVRVPRGGSLTGKVMKADGSPIADVLVNLISKESAGGPSSVRFTSRTNQKGVYKFENVLAGEYVVSAASENEKGNLDIRARLRGESQVVTFHPAAIRLADALIVKVDPGRESGGINITLLDRKTLKASGTLIRASDGSAVAGAIVVLRNKDSEATGPLMPGMSDRRTETTSDGKWSFNNLSPGDYEVTALSPVNGSPRDRGLVVGQPGGPRMGRPPTLGPMNPGPRPRFLITQKQLSLLSDDIEGLTLIMGGAGRIRGVVEVENGEPLAGNLTLFFEFLNEGGRPGRPEPVRVLENGSFTLENVPSGNRQMVAGLPNGSRYYVVSTTFGERDLSETPLPVVEDAEVGVVKVRLSSRFATISGRVAVGSKSGGVVVVLVPSGAAKQRFRIAYTAVQTAPDGSFTAKVAPGKYLVLALGRESLPPLIGPELIRSLNHGAESVLLLPGEQRILELRPSQR